MFYRKYYYRKITAQGSRKTLSKNYGARLAQGPLWSLKALRPDLRNPDFEAPDPRDLQNHAKTHMYRFGPKNLAREARQRSLHNAGKLPAPPGPPKSLAQLLAQGLAQDPRESNFSDKTLYIISLGPQGSATRSPDGGDMSRQDLQPDLAGADGAVGGRRYMVNHRVWST